MPLTIQVKGINVFGTHGVYEQEKKKGQEFRIDLQIELRENILNFEVHIDGCTHATSHKYKVENLHL